MKKAKQRLLVLLAICMVMCHAFVLTTVAVTIGQENMIIESIEVAGDEGEELQPMFASACNETNNDYMMYTMNQVAAQNGWSVGPLINGHANIMQNGVVIGRYDQKTAGYWGPHFHLYRNATNIHYTLSGY